jgi:hypothetical protein
MTSEVRQQTSAAPRARTQARLWIAIALVNGLVLAMELAEWGWSGQSNWRGILGSAGVEVLAVSVLVEPRHRALSVALLVLGLVCVVTSLGMRFWR